ncbi:MAG: DMT family transporter [Dehalococcoidia bacterium]|nr:DMT family transporter [Dehalococcoidia bacterium]
MFRKLASSWRSPSPGVSRLYLFLGAVLWSSGGFFIKEVHADAVSITFYRCVFAAAWLAPLTARRALPRATDAGVSVGLFALLLLLFVGSTKATTAANAIFLQYTAPLYIVAFGPLLLGERLRARDGPPLAICLVGIIVLVAGNQGSGDARGLWMGAGSGLFYGLFFLWLRRLRYADPVAITFINCVGVAALLAVVPRVWDVDARDLALLALMALVQFALPYVLFTRGIQEVRSAEASLIALIEPVLNPIWVVLLLGEDPSPATMAGGGVILGGLALRYSVFRTPGAAEPAVEDTELARPT